MLRMLELVRIQDLYHFYCRSSKYCEGFNSFTTMSDFLFNSQLLLAPDLRAEGVSRIKG